MPRPRGCSLFGGRRQGTAAAAARRRRRRRRSLLPVANQRFELAPGQDIVGTVQVVKASKEDTLTDIARRFNVGYEEIVRANPKVDPWLPGRGHARSWCPRSSSCRTRRAPGVVINIAAMRIFYYPTPKRGERAGRLSRTRSASARWAGARPRASPRSCAARRTRPGACRSSVRKEHHENGEDLEPVIGPGPDNPLGKYAFYLQWPSYLIHGTNKPAGVGLRSSHGCIRLYPEDIEQFFNMVPVGTEVRVVNQPFVFGWRDGQLYMQPFDVLEDDSRDWKKAQKQALDQVARGSPAAPGAGSTTNRSTGTRCRRLAHEPAASGADHRCGRRRSSRSSPRRRACRTCCRRARPGTASPTCRWTRRSFKQMASEIEPGNGSPDAPAATSAPPSPAAAARPRPSADPSPAQEGQLSAP